MNILIIGGTRFIGKAVVDSLSAFNLKFSVFSRNTGVSSHINHIKGDRNNSQDLESINGNYDVIIDFISYNEKHTKEIIHLFPNSRYILISTAWKKIEYSEKQELKFNYIQNKRLAEEEVLKSREKNNKNTIIRLPIILGLNDHTNRTNFFRQFNNNQIYLTNPDSNIYFCWKSDISDFIVSQILSKDKHTPDVIYPPSYFNLKLSTYIEMHQNLETIKYEIKYIERSQMDKDQAFINYVNTIAEDFYYPIEIFGKSKMKIDKLDRLHLFMSSLRDKEPFLT